MLVFTWYMAVDGRSRHTVQQRIPLSLSSNPEHSDSHTDLPLDIRCFLGDGSMFSSPGSVSDDKSLELAVDRPSSAITTKYLDGTPKCQPRPLDPKIVQGKSDFSS